MATGDRKLFRPARPPNQKSFVESRKGAAGHQAKEIVRCDDYEEWRRDRRKASSFAISIGEHFLAALIEIRDGIHGAERPTASMDSKLEPRFKVPAGKRSFGGGEAAYAGRKVPPDPY
jgi:hypothetical protein